MVKYTQKHFVPEMKNDRSHQLLDVPVELLLLCTGARKGPNQPAGRTKLC